MVGIVLFAKHLVRRQHNLRKSLHRNDLLIMACSACSSHSGGTAGFSPFRRRCNSDPLELRPHVSLQQQRNKADEVRAEGNRSDMDRDTKEIKRRLEVLHTEIKNAESYFTHIHWLQERFPSAKYEDVTGLCKLASQADLEEQDYSLNPGRYVGVVIEEDGKTEEEFIDDLSSMQSELDSFNNEALALDSVIEQNVRLITGERG